MDKLEKQKRVLNKMIGNKSKVQVYDRTTKSSKMIPIGSSNIKSASSSGRALGSGSSFSGSQKKKPGGCNSCNRKKGGG